MFTRIVTAGVLACLLVGCAKQTAKFTGRDDPAPAPKPQPADKGKPGDRNDKAGKNDKTKTDGDTPNWLNDPRFNKDNQLPTEGSSGKPGWGVKPPDGGWTPPNAPAPQPGNPSTPAQPGGGAPPQPSPPPAAGTPAQPTGGKPVAEADMKEVWIYIENASGASGKMPTPDRVLAALIEAKASAAALVRDGSIVLTNTRTRDSVWAYEVKATTQGGLVASQNGVETLTAAQLAARLAGR
jgi:hypothetical protein